MDSRRSFCFAILTIMITTSLAFQINAGDGVGTSSSSFSAALETLQNHINYTFHRIDLLRRSMTHASFSEENNRALSTLGGSIIETSVSFQYLVDDLDISPKTLNREISEITNVDSSCAVDGKRLGLDKIIRVSRKTNLTSPAIVCGAFRALFGAIALDSGKPDDAGNVFWKVHTRKGQLSTL